MRAPRALFALGLFLTACTGSESAIRGIVEQADREAIEMTVVAFLDAFAGSDTEAALGETVSGPRLEDWTRWIERFGRPEESLRGGRVELGGVSVDRVQSNEAVVRVDATVTSTLHEPGGRVVRMPRSFAGPMRLIRDPAAPFGWAVADLVRDGRPMSIAITVFDGAAEAEEGGIRVEVASLYRFSSGTFATLRISNASDEPVVVDRPRSLVQASGRFVGATATSDELASPIPPGASVEGAIDFHGIPLRWLPEGLALQFEGPFSVNVDLPFEAFLNPLAPQIDVDA